MGQTANSLTRSGRLGRCVISLALLLSAALWATWPVAKHFSRALPTSERHFGTVPMLNAWTLWWNSESLSRGLNGYWNAPIFFPTPGAFAFSEPQPILMLLAPLVWLSGSPIAAYNAYLIISLVLNGWFAMRLLRQAGCGWWLQVCGGLGMALHPLALRNIEAVQLVGMWGVLWTLERLIAFHRRPSPWSGSMLGCAFVSVALSCIHHWLFLSLLLAPTVWVVFPWRQVKAGLTGWTLALLVAALCLTPLLWPMHRILSQHEFSRDPEVTRSLSANSAGWLTAPPSLLIPPAASMLPKPSPDQFPQPLLPGQVRTCLALGILFLWRRRSAATVRLLLAVAAASLLLSFGSNLQFGNWNLWEQASHWITPLQRVRSPFRFAYFTQTAIILLAALAGDRLSRGLKLIRWRQSKTASMYGRALLAFATAITGPVLLACALESPPPPLRLSYPPSTLGRAADSDWTRFIAENTPAGASILCLPVAAGPTESAQQQSTRWMMYATLHGQPILNGYSGFFPAEWQALEKLLHKNPFSADALRELSRRQVAFIVVDSERFENQAQLSQLYALPPAELSLVFRYENVAIWKISRSTPQIEAVN